MRRSRLQSRQSRLKSRLPLTLTLVRRDDGGWDASLASRFGRERTLALAAAMAEALRPC